MTQMVTEREVEILDAHFIKGLLDEQYPDCAQVVLVMDNLNTHSGASLYEAFTPQEALRLLRRLEIHYTEDARGKLRKLYPSFQE
jgi:hypothetical protein